MSVANTRRRSHGHGCREGEALDVELPTYSEARIESADLTDVQPAEYRADLVVLLCDERPALGIVIEVQLRRDEDKVYVWPVYATGLRARVRCPVCLLVVTPDDTVARWAAKTIDIGGSNGFTPLVLGPSGVPVVTDPREAKRDPELAVLSAMAHGRDPDSALATHVALAALSASAGLDRQRGLLYADLVHASLAAAAREALKAMDPAKYEYQSEFARRYYGQGQAEKAAEIVLRLLTLRFGPLPADVVARVESAAIEDLDRWSERILTAESLAEVF